MPMKRSKRRRISVVCLLSLSLSSEASRAAKTHSRVSYPISPWTLRGGAANNGGGGDSSAGDLDDEELDDYIDFLLAAADDKVTEADNPLFKRFPQLAKVQGNQPDKNEVLLTTSTTATTLKPMEHVTVDTILESVEEESGCRLHSDSSPAVVIEEIPKGLTPDSHMKVDNITLDTRTEPFEEDAGEALVSSSIDVFQDDLLVTTSSPMINELDSATLETVTVSAKKNSDGESLHPSTMNDSVPVDEKVMNLDTTVWDVDDVNQLDDMIDTLVAAVDEEHSSTGRDDEKLPETRLEDEPLQDALENNDGDDEEVEVEDVQVLVDTETVGQIPETELVESALASGTTDPNDVGLESSIGSATLGEEEMAATTIETAAVEISIAEEPVDQETTGCDSSVEVLQDVAPIDSEDQMEPKITLNANDEVSAMTTATSSVDSQGRHVSMIAADDDRTSTSSIESNLEQVVEFFLGPSAVDESPQLTEDVIAESRPAATAVIDSTNEIKQDKDDTPVVVDDVKTSKSDTLMSETKQTMHAARKTWGKWTALLLGITPEKEPRKSSLRSHTPTWGKWTARLMGIETEKLAGSRSTNCAGAPKKDIDRIYNKYFLDYTPDPFTRPSGMEAALDSTDVGAPNTPDDEQSVRQEHVPSPLNGITRLWGKIDKALKHERSKPMTFLADTAPNVSELDLDTNVTECTPIDEEEKPLETTVVDSHEDGEEESLEVVADVAPEEVAILTVTGEDAVPSDEDMVQGKVDVAFTSEAKSGSDEQIGSVKTDETFVELSSQEEELDYDDEDEEEEEENISATIVEVDVEAANEPSSLEIGDAEDPGLNREISNIDDASIAGSVETISALSSETNEEEEEWELSAYDGMVGEAVDYSESDDSFTHPQVEDIDSERYSAFDEEGVNKSMDDEEFEVESRAQVMGEGVSVPLKEERMNVFQTFLVMRGLEAWVMTIILFLEWCRFYLSPVSDVFAFLSAPNDLSNIRVASLKASIFARLRGGSEVHDNSGPSTDDGGEGALHHVNQTGPPTDEEVTADTPTVQVAPPIVSRQRPNALYRYLFSYGRLGHVLIMEIVLFHEWMETYLPFASTSIKWAVAQMFPRVFGQVESGDLPLSQTTGFVGADGTAIRGAKKRSSQMRKEDQRALDQLKKVGDVSQARYRFLSEGFMQRHGIGRFAEEENLVARRASEIDDYSAPLREKGDALTVSEPESDAEWIVSALAQEEEDVLEKMPSGRKGLLQPTVTVGFEIGSGSRHRKKRSRISDTTWLTSEREKKQVGPRLSDRDSGVIGRIRAAGANSLVGRNILGAYPGDVPSPSDAADPRGLTEFAQRYGYGDWSDSEEDSRLTYHDRDDGSRRKKKRRRKGVEINFGVGIGTKSASSPVPRTRAKINRRTPELLDEKKVNNVRGVGKAGLDAFERSAARKRKESDSKKQNLSTGATAKLQAAKSQLEKTGRSSVASKALEQLKEKAKRSDDSQ